MMGMRYEVPFTINMIKKDRAGQSVQVLEEAVMSGSGGKSDNSRLVPNTSIMVKLGKGDII